MLHLLWHVAVLNASVEELKVAGEEVPLGEVVRTEWDREQRESALHFTGRSISTQSWYVDHVDHRER